MLVLWPGSPARGNATTRSASSPSWPARHRRRRGSAGGRPVTYDVDAHRRRNNVERAINKLRGYRAVATRFDKRDYVYRGTVDVASIGIWLRDPVT